MFMFFTIAIFTYFSLFILLLKLLFFVFGIIIVNHTKEQNDNFKAEMRQYKSGDVNAHLNANETALFEQLLWNALLGGYEDFPEV